MSTTTQEKPKETPATLVEASRLIFLDPKKLQFFKHGATLRLTIEDDRSFPKVGILRAFPLSDRNRFLSVRDSAENEIGLIVNLMNLALNCESLWKKICSAAIWCRQSNASYRQKNGLVP